MSRTQVGTRLLGAGSIVQAVRVETTVMTSGSTTYPWSDAIPTTSGGTELFALAITPTSATSILRVFAVVNLAGGGASNQTVMALFRDSGTNAISASMGPAVTGEGMFDAMPLMYEVVSGSVSATTFKIRVGAVGSWTVNGYGGVRKYGGVLRSHMTITEIAA